MGRRVKHCLIGGGAGLVCDCVCPSIGACQYLQLAAEAAVVNHPALAGGAGGVGDEAVLGGIVHDGFIDGFAIVVVVAAVKVIDFGAVVDVVFDAVHRPDRVRAAHLNLDILY